MHTHTLAQLIVLPLSLALSQLVAAAQNNQSVEGLSCSTELSVVFGDAFQASCAGDLTVQSGSLIEAVESISLSAEGNIMSFGTLVAPNILLTANGTTSISGGLFSGSSEIFPIVTATSYASGSLTVSTFEDLVSHPFVHPIYGAVTFTSYEVTVSTTLSGIEAPVLSPTLSVPEPHIYAMLGVGFLMVMGRIRNSRNT